MIDHLYHRARLLSCGCTVEEDQFRIGFKHRKLFFQRVGIKNILFAMRRGPSQDAYAGVVGTLINWLVIDISPIDEIKFWRQRAI